MRILEQATAQIPDGPIRIDDPRLMLPPKQDVYGSIEGLMNHFKLVIEGQKIPPGEVYVATEGGNGELGFYLVSDGSGRPYRVRVRPPCFYGMAALGGHAARRDDRRHHHHVRAGQHDWGASVTDSPRFSDAALAEYRSILERYPTRRAALMPTLWLAQREFGWLSDPAQSYVADLMELPLAWVTSVSSFYTMYWKRKPARWHLQVCRNLACALRGADEVRVAIERRLGFTTVR